ncbi:Vacuolar membrane protease {ECO:0000250/UniProtKB:P38244} {ECO:0000305}; AltName: Full=FXNA-related family protease 1 {ECO:0000250/UniProtKB:P38244} [Serendipita indica DSM 11827]|uniref:Peptide hydrolase n=1 Tax=Serendipita indica (strain DSM 11827) TaxID=1109443 RepID=G4TJ84_SERID|nr:Vacuolar membrane protease {ECO:0000250/UniProtKB:P38244} {ECO:0000305}; AltName: Full=FXNA-related family protease 1 {ECO:0000250/UniProtKB:P38244} [Serendipita indica DSM 11827]CCA71364.1 hypothetical protein PIIN_05303 [Serendipita indica DSM 11827]
MRFHLPPLTPLWVTRGVVVLYVFIFLALVRVHEVLPSAPSQENALRQGINLEGAWDDLQVIAQKPHPYNSRENVLVRNYLLDRVKGLARQYTNIHISDDLVSNTSYVEAQRLGYYVEGSNILVKVLGTNGALPAVLFSAHFDTSATAPGKFGIPPRFSLMHHIGATDDGVGVVSLLSLIEQFASQPPLRNTIFNLNNAEEEGLCGAHVFLQHPWAQEADSFLNIEGAGAGGRPILFRASSSHLVRAFQETSRPHGTVTSSDAFSLGLIRSMTDFEVYAGPGGMKGLDVSFYVNRDKYHTPQDNIENLQGRAPLWAGLKLARDVGYQIANSVPDKQDEKAVYWDILGRYMAVIDFSTFIAGIPTLIMIMTGIVVLLAGNLWYKGHTAIYSSEWAYFPWVLMVATLWSLFFTSALSWLNPSVIYSSPYPVIVCIACSILLSLHFPLHLIGSSVKSSPNSHKTLILSQLVIFAAITLLGYHWVLSKSAFGGFYFVEFLYAGATSALILDLGSRTWASYRGSRITRLASPRTTDEAEEPLLEMSSRGEAVRRARPAMYTPHHQGHAWVLEFLVLSVPIAIMTLQLVLVLAAGLGQTLADGSPPLMVYAGITVLTFFALLPIAPFAHLLNRLFFIFVAGLFVTTFFYNILAFPFSYNRRIKFFYRQHLNLDNGRNTVELLGLQPALRDATFRIPSVRTRTANVTWGKDPDRGLPSITWQSHSPQLVPFTPHITPLSMLDELVLSSATRIDADSAVFTVKGKDTKSCVLQFDQNIIDVRVHRRDLVHADAHGWSGTVIQKEGPYAIPSHGIPMIKLYGREWGAEFEVTVRWNSTDESQGRHKGWRSFLFSRGSARWPKRTGRIGCQWQENVDGRFPALDELYEHLPDWATLTVKKPFLLADRAFSI